MSLFRINIFLYDYSIAITLHMTKKNFQFMIYFHDKIYICLIRTNILSHKTQLQYTEDLMVFRIAANQGNLFAVLFFILPLKKWQNNKSNSQQKTQKYADRAYYKKPSWLRKSSFENHSKPETDAPVKV